MKLFKICFHKTCFPLIRSEVRNTISSYSVSLYFSKIIISLFSFSEALGQILAEKESIG